MANVRNANTFYIDTQHISDPDALDEKNIKANYITLTATAANGRIVLADNNSNEILKLDLRVATSGDTAYFDFSDKPILFPNGIRVKTLSNAVATVVVGESQI